MSQRSEFTLAQLNDALERILQNVPEIVKPKKTISVSMVEREAGLGVGTAYYYPEIIDKIKNLKQDVLKPNKTKEEKQKSKKKALDSTDQLRLLKELQQQIELRVQSEANLVYHLWRAQEKIRDIEIKLAHSRVTPMHKN